jgi:hypothetical protein
MIFKVTFVNMAICPPSTIGEGYHARVKFNSLAAKTNERILAIFKLSDEVFGQ